MEFIREMNRKVLVNLSNRHVHLTQEHVEKLFGPGRTLTNIKGLVQPGQFACDECVTLEGDKGKIEKVRIIGPVRAKSQVEVLKSDVFKLTRKEPPVRESGDLAGSVPVTLVGPAGRVELSEGVIIAARHVHMEPETAQAWGVKDKQVVKLRAGVPGREVVFENVVLRVNKDYALECHIDFDEGNACGIGNGVMAEVIL